MAPITESWNEYRIESFFIHVSVLGTRRFVFSTRKEKRIMMK